MNLNDNMTKEEADLKQRSKVSWLKLGDTKSRFFSIATRMWRAKNQTLRILNSVGNQIITRTQLETNNMRYFQKSWLSTSPILITFPRVVSKADWLTHPPLWKRLGPFIL